MPLASRHKWDLPTNGAHPLDVGPRYLRRQMPLHCVSAYGGFNNFGYFNSLFMNVWPDDSNNLFMDDWRDDFNNLFMNEWLCIIAILHSFAFDNLQFEACCLFFCCRDFIS